MSSRLRTPFIFILFLTVPAAGDASAELIDGSLELVLNEATIRPERGSTIRPAIRLSLHFVDGKLVESGTFSVPEFSRGEVTGEVRDLDVDGSSISLKAEVTIHDDPWIKGGKGQYEAEITRKGRTVTGRWSGSFQQAGTDRRKLSGKITGIAVDHWPDLAESVQFKPGEHPRLLFDKDDIATLRQRAKTPQGKKLMDELRRLLSQADRGFAWNKCAGRTSWKKRCATPYSEGYYAVGEAAMFLLTDKKVHLERAKHRMLDAMCSRDGEAGGWGNAPRMTGVALCYDMLYHHLDEEFRRTIRGFLRQPRPDLTWPLSDLGSYHAMFGAAETLCDLALLGDPVDPPVKPQRVEQAPVIEPLADDQIGEGVPVQDYRSGVMPSRLLLLGTYEVNGRDPLASLGGPAKAKPSRDTSITHGGETRKARLMEPPATRLSYGHNYRGHPAIGFDLRLWGGEGRKSMVQTIYAYAVIEVEKDRAVIAQPDMPDVSVGNRIWINGHALKQGDVVRLKKGKYGLLLAVPVRGLFAAPHLQNYDEQAAFVRYRRDLVIHEAEGETAPGASRRLGKHVDYLRRYLARSMGDRGYMLEQFGITDMRSELMLAASAYENMFGKPLAPDSGLKWTIPLNIHYNRRYWGCDWGSAFWPAFAFPNLVDKKYRPAIRWWIDRELEELEPADSGYFPGLTRQPNHPFYLLLTYPWETESQPPSRWQFPLVLADKKVGLYLMRSGWDPDRSICVSVVAQQDSLPTSLYAGTSMISNWQRGYLLGHQHLGAGYFVSPRRGGQFFEKGRQFRIGDLQPKGGAKVTLFKPQEDGSAVVSLTIDKWVSVKKFNRIPSATPIEGVRLERAVGVDYSGASGAEAVIVYVDRVHGAGKRPVEFRLPLPPSWRKTQGDKTGRTFVLDRGGKRGDPEDKLTMSVTYVACGSATYEKGKGRSYGAILATGAPEQFVVLTLQNGSPPEVSVSGTGLESKVTVGKQEIHFDGKKVVFRRQVKSL